MLITGLGSASTWHEELIRKLEERHKKMIEEESAVIRKTRQEIGFYVEELQSKSRPDLPQEAAKIGATASTLNEGSSQD